MLSSGNTFRSDSYCDETAFVSYDFQTVTAAAKKHTLSAGAPIRVKGITARCATAGGSLLIYDSAEANLLFKIRMNQTQQSYEIGPFYSSAGITILCDGGSAADTTIRYLTL
jgi:hypothetical protein